MPQGSSVKKGESVAQADFRILDKSIEDYERTIKSKNLEVLKLRYALDQQKERSALALQKYQTALARTEEDQKDFLENGRPACWRKKKNASTRPCATCPTSRKS